MIRRSIVALATLVLAVSAMSGCATFSANRNAATVNGTDLGVDEFEEYMQGFADNPDAFQVAPATAAGLPGDTARGILTAWIRNSILADALADRGASVTPEQRKALEDQILAGGAAGVWAKLSAPMKAFVLDAQSVEPAFNAAFGDQAQAELGGLLSDASITIDSRYGMWDPVTATVVATL